MFKEELVLTAAVGLQEQMSLLKVIVDDVVAKAKMSIEVKNNEGQLVGQVLKAYKDMDKVLDKVSELKIEIERVE